MVGTFKKTHMHKPVKILRFHTPAKIQKCLTYIQTILAVLTIHNLQAESRILQWIFLHFTPARIQVPGFER